MANSVHFPEANLQLHGPAGPEDPDVTTVHARRLDGTVVTCWQLTDEDVAEINATGGLIWLSCWGRSMPPVMISGRKADVI